MKKKKKKTAMPVSRFHSWTEGPVWPPAGQQGPQPVGVPPVFVGADGGGTLREAVLCERLVCARLRAYSFAPCLLFAAPDGSQGLGGGPGPQIRQQTSGGIWQAASKTCPQTPVVLASRCACPSTSDRADPGGL